MRKHLKKRLSSATFILIYIVLLPSAVGAQQTIGAQSETCLRGTISSCGAPKQGLVESADYILPKVGAVFDVDREIFGVKESSIYNVVATGPDFVIYYEGRLESSGRFDGEALSVEFSGIYPESCMEKLPDRVNRAHLAGLWPLRSGNQTDFIAHRTKGSYRVKNQSMLQHKERKIPVYWVEGKLKESGFKSSVAIALKSGHAVPMSAKWGEFITVYRYEAAAEPDVSINTIRGKYKILNGLNLNKFGKCKALFE